jgi:hypothetical protein
MLGRWRGEVKATTKEARKGSLRSFNSVSDLMSNLNAKD